VSKTLCCCRAVPISTRLHPVPGNLHQLGVGNSLQLPLGSGLCAELVSMSCCAMPCCAVSHAVLRCAVLAAGMRLVCPGSLCWKWSHLQCTAGCTCSGTQRISSTQHQVLVTAGGKCMHVQCLHAFLVGACTLSHVHSGILFNNAHG
jgi:hypothetical protein